MRIPAPWLECQPWARERKNALPAQGPLSAKIRSAENSAQPLRPYHPKAMPVILTEPDQIEAWMTGTWTEASELQKRQFPNDALEIFERD
ncbi:hypothetical protein ACERNI_13475 [Camelimonas sp. ID_303_24]